MGSRQAVPAAAVDQFLRVQDHIAIAADHIRAAAEIGCKDAVTYGALLEPRAALKLGEIAAKLAAATLANKWQGKGQSG